MKNSTLTAMLPFCFSLLGVPLALAQSQDPPPLHAESQFRELFTTAAYSTVLGAAFGASLLPFTKSSTENSIRTVTSGASIGFMLGSTYGLFLVIRNGLGFKTQPVPTRTEDPYYDPQIEGLYGSKVSRKTEQSFGNSEFHSALITGKNGKIFISMPDLELRTNGIGISLLNASF